MMIKYGIVEYLSIYSNWNFMSRIFTRNLLSENHHSSNKFCCFILMMLFCVFVIPSVNAFNIETNQFVMHRGQPDSLFGFTVAQHKEGHNYWMLVGAPEAQTRQRGVIKGGSVYKCSLTITDDCEPIPFDETGDFYDSLNHQVERKSNQWFGASLKSRSGVVVACAPRYTFFNSHRLEPIGNCFYSSGIRDKPFIDHSPCREERKWGFHKQGFCQAGYGTALTQDGNGLYIGTVGSYYWQGQVFYQNLLSGEDKLSTPEGPSKDDSGYMGYSLSTGHFNSDEEEDIAVGMPRGNFLTGQVVLMNHKLKGLLNITGDQIGSYFGYSVAVLDADGDGLDDIAVGAPWYTYNNPENQGFEQGLVAVYKQLPEHNFKNSTRLLGQASRSHFGLSVSSLGDLNLDGYDDLAVGAPKDGSGAVYIYLGGPNGISSKYSQVLRASEITEVPLSNFGWSVSGGEDMDFNSYPDLVVGAHESNRAFFFRARPVVSVSTSIRFKSEGGSIDLSAKDCSLQDSTSVSCIPLHYCLQYTGIGSPIDLDLFITVNLDVDGAVPSRLSFLTEEGKSIKNLTISLDKDVESCHHTYVYVVNNPRDKLTPLVAQLDYSLLDRPVYSNPPELKPVLAPSSKSFSRDKRATVYIRNECGHDNICIPNLNLKTTLSSNEYILGSETNIEMKIHLRNLGEDAFLSRLFLSVPKEMHFSKHLVLENNSPEVEPFCSKVQLSAEEDQDVMNEQVICEVGNPFPTRGSIKLLLTFQPRKDYVKSAFITFKMLANSTNNEMNEKAMEDNIIDIRIPVFTSSFIDIKGVSWPEGAFNYNISSFGEELLGSTNLIAHERHIGPEVTHVYDVKNSGPSTLFDFDLYLLWPTKTLAGEPLLYMLESPEISPNSIKCDPIYDVNYLDLVIDGPSADLYHIKISDMFLNEEANQKSKLLHKIQKRESLYHSSLQDIEERKKMHPSSNLIDDSSYSSPDINDLLSCGPTNCTKVKCKVNKLDKGENIVVKVRSRLWVDTIKKLGMTEVMISSRLVIHDINSSPSENVIQSRPGEPTSWHEKVTTDVRTGGLKDKQPLKWLIILGSIIAGLLVLAIISTILWMLGFFKRRRHQHSSD